MTDSFLRVEGLTRRFGDFAAVDNVSFELGRGKILALLGPSGSGKTTTLRLLAGFDSVDTGKILVGGKDVTSLDPAARRFGMVFQHYALFPHMTVAQNVGFGLRSLDRDEQAARIEQVLSLVDMEGFQSRPVTALSGGQQQRVAVARALAPNPAVLLFDEPLSNLDPALREKTRRELRNAIEETGITTVFVTHEQEEAFALGDEVAVLNQGRLEQIGPAPELYGSPASLFVGGFVGRASKLSAEIVGPGQVRVDSDIVWPTRVLGGATSGKVDVLIRPEHASFASEGLPGKVVAVRYSGARAFFTVETRVGEIEVESPVESASNGDAVHVTASTSHSFPVDS